MLTRTLVVLGLLFGPSIHAQESGADKPVGSNDEVITGIEEALSLDPADDLDAALAAAWTARFDLTRVDDPTIRTDLANRVRARLEDSDAEYRSTNKDLSAAANRLVTQAAGYARLDWFEVATRLLDEADRFELGTAQDARDRIESSQARSQRAAGSAAAKAAKPFIHQLKNVHESEGWRRSELGYLANLEGRRGAKLEALGTRHEDARLSVDVYPPENGRTQAGLMFARKDSVSYLLIDAAWNAGESTAKLRLYEVFDAGEINLIVSEDYAIVPTEDGPRIRIIVEVEGKTVRFGSKEDSFIDHEYPGRTYGSVGFVVSGYGEHEGSVEFRNLSIETLTPLLVTEEAENEANLAAVRARVRAGQKRVRREEPEEASLEFLAAFDLLANLDRLDVIKAEKKAIDSHWRDADPQARKHDGVRRYIASQLTKRAKDYRKEGHVRTALVLLDEALRADAEVAFAAHEQARADLER